MGEAAGAGQAPLLRPCPVKPEGSQETSQSPFGRMGWTSLMRKGFEDPFRSEPALETAFAVLQQVMADSNVEHPDTCAAIVGVCGRLDPAKAAMLANTSIWVLHAAEDCIVEVTVLAGHGQGPDGCRRNAAAPSMGKRCTSRLSPISPGCPRTQAAK